jgi:hypothetical protein
MKKPTHTTLHALALCLILIGGATAPHVAAAQTCPTFTTEQDVLLRKAYAIGNYDDWGWTLAAIVWRESIVGQYIVRINGQDGQQGSYGVAHMQITTAAYLTGEENLWRAKATLAPTLINNDTLALELALKYLQKHQDLGWRGMIARYNGKGKQARMYSDDVVARVKTLQACTYTG